MTEKTKGGFLVSQVKQVQARIFEKLLKDEGIDCFNGAQGRILFVLWQNNDLPISELGQRTSLSKSTLTSMLDRMEAQGHIQRKADPEDRRQIRITLTEAAKSMNERYMQVSSRMNDVFYRSFTEEEIIGFDSYLERILDNLKRFEEDY